MENIQKNLSKTQIASNILYLFLAFPLGLLYFIALVVGLSVGFGTIIIWIGIPILSLTLLGILGMAALERELAVRLLHVHMPLMSGSQRTSRSWRSWFAARISDPLTWKSLVYLLIKFPLGTFSFVLTLTLVTSSFALILEPLAYLIHINVDGILAVNHIVSQSWMPFVGFFSGGEFDVFAFGRSFIGLAAGGVLWLVSCYILNGLAWMSGEFARIMLSPLGSNATLPKDEQPFYQPQSSSHAQYERAGYEGEHNEYSAPQYGYQAMEMHQ
jgi:hypothetical protein